MGEKAVADKTMQAGSEIGVQIDATRDGVLRYLRTGDDLAIELKNGDRVLVDGFYTPAENGSLHSLVFSDGAVADLEQE
ncbi:BapA prefix-like domain-containing protein, partial [Pseudoalteromonas sp. SIMBA_153]